MHIHYRGRINGGGDLKSLGLLPDKLKTELALHVNLETLKKVQSFLCRTLHSSDTNNANDFFEEKTVLLMYQLGNVYIYICAVQLDNKDNGFVWTKQEMYQSRRPILY